MSGQEIAIQLQNELGCFEFLMRHFHSWQNQTYEPSRIYNENE